MGSNLPLLFGLSALSLTTGYYLGQLCPSKGLANVTDGIDQKRQKKLHSNNNSIVEMKYNEDSIYETEEEYDDEIIVDSNVLNEVAGEVRMALIVRQDLGMTKGKIAAQCCHAAVACYRSIGGNPTSSSYNPTMLSRWLSQGQAKITLRCPNKEEMDELLAKAIAYNVNCYMVHDAGRTQIAAGSATVLGLGPAPKAVLDEITGHLKLY